MLRSGRFGVGKVKYSLRVALYRGMGYGFLPIMTSVIYNTIKKIIE